jgi:peroxidase
LLPKAENGEFISGDRRVNQNVLLTALHTIFVREHNRICEDVTTRNSALTDEEVYQIGRNYVIGLIQHITFDDWFPNMLGRMIFNKYIGDYKFDPETNPGIFTEFQVGALRVFDSFIPTHVTRQDLDFGLQLGSIEYKHIIENPELINKTSFAEYLTAAGRLSVKAKRVDLINDLRESFISPDFPNEETDLYSLNLQRGRDHGVGSLKDIREALGLSPVNISQAFINQPRLDCL